MVQLKDIDDIQDLEIVSLDELLERRGYKGFKEKFKQIEKRIVEEGKASSLTAYLLYEHQFRQRSLTELASEIGICRPSIQNLFKNAKIPKRSGGESSKLEKNKKKVSEKNKRVSDEECASFMLDYVFFNDSINQLKEDYGIKSRPQSFYSRAIDMGIITKEQFERAAKRRKEKSDRSQKTRAILDYDELRQFSREYVECITPSGDLLKEYGLSQVSQSLDRAINLGHITNGERERAAKIRKNNDLGNRKYSGENLVGFEKGRTISEEERKEMSSMRKGDGNSFFGKTHTDETKERIRLTHENPEAKLRDRENGIKAAIRNKKTKFIFNGRLYDSNTEAVVANLFEKYMPGYKVIEGETFQINSKSGALLDFILPDGKILEWHPVNITYDASREDRQAYRELISQLPPKERGEFKRWYHDEIALDYWISRQEKVDSSPIFHGREVILVRNFDELYKEVLSFYNVDIPNKNSLKIEYNELKSQVRRVSRKVLENRVKGAA